MLVWVKTKLSVCVREREIKKNKYEKVHGCRRHGERVGRERELRKVGHWKQPCARAQP